MQGMDERRQRLERTETEMVKSDDAVLMQSEANREVQSQHEEWEKLLWQSQSDAEAQRLDIRTTLAEAEHDRAQLRETLVATEAAGVRGFFITTTMLLRVINTHTSLVPFRRTLKQRR